MLRRFTWRSRRRAFRKTMQFCRTNGQLLFLVLLICLGAVAGAVVYTFLSSDDRTAFASLLSSTTVPTNFLDGCIAVLSSGFYGVLLLIVLFLLGLTAYGCPLIVLVPLFFGVCIGVAECHAYMFDGLWTMLCTVLIPVMITGMAIVTATGQALRMSCAFSRQLLPSHAHCGGLWQDFKLYLIRFAICLLIVLAGAIIAVLLRLM